MCTPLLRRGQTTGGNQQDHLHGGKAQLNTLSTSGIRWSSEEWHVHVSHDQKADCVSAAVFQGLPAVLWRTFCCMTYNLTPASKPSPRRGIWGDPLTERTLRFSAGAYLWLGLDR